VLKIFNIQTREGSVVSFMNVIWQVSYANWLKVNTKSAAKGCLDSATSVGIFRGI